MPRALLLVLLLAGCSAGRAETPVDARPGTGTPELGANADLHGAQIFPADNPWNRRVDTAAVDPRSDAIIAAMGADLPLHPDFGTVWQGAPNGIPYIVVAGDTKRVPVTFRYADESDPGPYPIPADAPIEGGPASTGDRHVLILDRDRWKLYELFDAHPPAPGATGWTAGGGAIFDLRSNALRPAGWTSADAAGLPIFPGLVRYDEVAGRGAITHALRFTVTRARRGYVFPARHAVDHETAPDLPPMGMRVRLKADYDISRFPSRVQVILTALKTYGMIVADVGGPWYVSGAPDPRWHDGELHELQRVTGRDFEVVRMDRVVDVP